MPRQHYRVLVAEDDPQLRDVLFEGLTLEGFDVCCVADGAAARGCMAEAGPFDALLLDDRMPHVTGVELLRELRASGQSVPVVLLSGHCQLGDDEWEELRPSALLRKPLTLGAIARALREAIDRAADRTSEGVARWSRTRPA